MHGCKYPEKEKSTVPRAKYCVIYLDRNEFVKDQGVVLSGPCLFVISMKGY